VSGPLPRGTRSAAGIAVTVCVLGLVPLAVLAALSLVWSERALRDSAQDRIRESSAAAAAFVTTRLAGLEDYLKTFADDPGVLEPFRVADPTADLAQRLQPVVDTVLSGDPTLTIASVLSPQGVILATTLEKKYLGMDMSGRDYFTGAVRTGRAYVSTVYTSILPGNPLMTNAIVPIRLAVDDPPVGYLTAARQLSITQGYVRSYADVADIGMTLTDQSGAVVASTGDRSLGQVDPGNAGWVTPALRGDSGVMTIDTSDGPQLLSYRALPSGWTVAAHLPESTMLAPWYDLRSAVLVLSLVLAAGFAVPGLVIFYMTRGRQRAVTALGAAHEQLATANAHLEARVEQRTRELSAAVDDLEGFAYSVSHDLRAPLRAISGFSQALDDDARTLDDTDRHYLQRIRAAADTMGHLIDDLLRLSRVGRSQLSIGPVDITPIARDIAAETARGAPGVDPPTVHVADGIVVHADRQLITVALQNLIGNALKFTRDTPNPAIEIGHHTTEEETVIFVRDNGCGFDMTYADKLFQPFQRLHTHEQFDGTGIGLATVARIARRHGGRVWADSTPGHGATFYLALPRTHQQPAAT